MTTLPASDAVLTVALTSRLRPKQIDGHPHPSGYWKQHQETADAAGDEPDDKADGIAA